VSGIDVLQWALDSPTRHLAWLLLNQNKNDSLSEVKLCAEWHNAQL